MPRLKSGKGICGHETIGNAALGYDVEELHVEP
jgi:hypothetical protein